MNNEADRYFNWLCSQVDAGPEVNYRGRRRLLYFLFNKEFVWSIFLDKNRAEEGINMRYEFGNPDIDLPKEANCLEVIVSIAQSIERIMDDPFAGNRTAKWFCDMLKSLDIYDMTDTRFDDEAACIFIDNWLERTFEPNGRGGLFTLYECPYDARDMEIWSLMNWYLRGVE